MNTKRCPQCMHTLPIEMFWKNKAAPDGLQSQCKTCLGARINARKAQLSAQKARLKAEQLQERARHGKVCSSCGEQKNLSEFRVRPEAPDGRQGRCRCCMAEAHRAVSLRYRNAHIDACRQYIKEWRSSLTSDDLEKLRAARLQRWSEHRSVLSDTYVRKLLSDRSDFVSATDIPQALVEVKRQHLLLLREISERNEDENGGDAEERSGRGV